MPSTTSGTTTTGTTVTTIEGTTTTPTTQTTETTTGMYIKLRLDLHNMIALITVCLPLCDTFKDAFSTFGQTHLMEKYLPHYGNATWHTCLLVIRTSSTTS